MKDFLMRQFDKLVLLLLVVMSWGITLFVIFHTTDMVILAWALGLAGPVVGALLTLITGAIQKASANPNNDK